MKLIHFFTEKKRFLNLGEPKPAKQFIPDWYRSGENTYTDPDTNMEVAGLKACMPVLDTLLTGYMLVTPSDIFVSKSEDGSLNISWSSVQDLDGFVNERSKKSGATIPRPAGHYPNHLVWSGFWGWKTPRGYSTIVTHPLNRFDLPFTTMSGIVDSDKFSATGNLPFFIKENFIGTIPAGTPFAQIIPMKRSEWKMINNPGLENLEHLNANLVRQPETSYKKKMWQRKKYN